MTAVIISFIFPEARLLSLENNPEDDGDDENDKKLRKRVKRKRRTKDNGVKHVYSIKWKAK